MSQVIEADEINRRLGYHPATEVTGPAHDRMRRLFIAAANVVACETPPSREQALALTAIQEALMWANAAIACNQ